MAISGGDGSIILDTKVDTKGLNGGLNSMKDAITKIGGLLAAAFSVKMLINFAKESKNLYKIQMQNEVKLATVMRQRMKATDDEIKSMLELTSAQQQIGIIGDEVQLAGLQQLATFANQKETIETLLPAMNNLIAQQYGYEASTESARNAANLMGKVLQGQVGALTRVGITFSAAEEQMLKTGNEMERAAVLAQVITNNVGEMNSALAQTDVGRQQQLANTWGDIKEQFGAAFQQIAIIALPVLNAVAKALAWVANIARMVAQTIANMFGMKTSGGGGGNQNAGIGGMATSTEQAAEGMSDLGNATEKAGKQAKKSTASFDDLQILTESAASSAGEAAEEMSNVASGIGGEVGTGFDFGIQSDVDTTPLETALGRIKGFLKPIQKMFMSGFWQGFQNADFSGIEQSISGIKESLTGIFTSPEVQNSAQGFVSSVILAFGKFTGSIVSIGKTCAENLLGGFNLYLDGNSETIKTRISNIFDASSGIATSVGNMWETFSDIFSVFADTNGQTLTSNIIGIFANARLGIAELAYKIGEDFINFLTQPIIENQEGLKNALDSVLGYFSEIAGGIKSIVDNLVEEAQKTYDEHIKPLIDTLTESFTRIVKKLTEAWNTYISPVLDELGERFNYVATEYVNPAIDSIMGFLGRLADIVSDIWVNYIEPFFLWFIDEFSPIISTTVAGVGEAFNLVVGVISEVVTGIMDSLNLLLDFMTGDFQGDWEDVGEALKNIWKGVANGIIDLFESAVNFIIRQLNKISFDVPGWVPGIGGQTWGFNLEEVSLPRLAQGAVIPPNREFLAVLGDQKHGTNIEAPADLIKQKVMEAMIEMGGNFGGGRNIEVVLEMDRRELGRAVVEVGNEENRRIGTRLVIA